jgi:hypothetical protein
MAARDREVLLAPVRPLMIGGWARFPTQGVGFRAGTLIMPVSQLVCATAKMRRNGNQVLPSGRIGYAARRRGASSARKAS